jgi:hypothetical protein
MVPQGLLWKYLGLDDMEKARTSFLHDCLFRVSQPRALNDPFEMKPRVLMNKYSSEDWAIAREGALRDGMPPEMVQDDEEVESYALLPYPAPRFDEQNFPALWPALIPELREAPFSTLAEVDEFRATQVREELEQQLNQSYGVLSLTKNPKQLVMWAHYAAKHQGVVVGFHPHHPFFKQIGLLDEVEYCNERVAVSSNYGVIRVAGRKLVDGEPPPQKTLFRKHPDWRYEEEYRLIVDLAKADVTPHSKLSEEAVHLLRFPHTCIKALLLGARFDDMQMQALMRDVRQQAEWHELRLFRARLSDSEFALEFDEIE